MLKTSVQIVTTTPQVTAADRRALRLQRPSLLKLQVNRETLTIGSNPNSLIMYIGPYYTSEWCAVTID
jgi:hypothetical protein